MPVLAILSAIKGFAGTALGVVAKYPWQALCALLAVFAAWQTHIVHVRDRTIQAHASAIALFVRADATNHATIEKLLASLADQSAHVRAWDAAAKARLNASQNALRSSQERAKAMEAAAVRIDAGRAQRASGGTCVTPSAVVDARGEL